MPRPAGRMGVAEKSKDFKGSIIRLFNNLENWKVLLIIAIVLSIFSAVLSTIAPNRLSGITDVISDGIKPNIEKLQTITQKIYSNLNVQWRKKRFTFNTKYSNSKH